MWIPTGCLAVGGVPGLTQGGASPAPTMDRAKAHIEFCRSGSLYVSAEVGTASFLLVIRRHGSDGRLRGDSVRRPAS